MNNFLLNIFSIDNRPNGVLKLANQPRNNDGFWLDTATSVWRPSIPKEQIPDYAPVCTTNTLPLDQQQRRFAGEYTEFPADYAEVSTFRKPPSECSGNRSPAPYATTTLVGSNRNPQYRYNNNQNMYFTSDLYPSDGGHYIRNVYSESYYNPKEKISENHQIGHNSNTYSNTYNPSVSVPQTPIGTIRKNRFKLTPANYRISFGDGAECQSAQQQQNEQFYVKVGETNRNGTIDSMKWSQPNNRSLYSLKNTPDKDVIYAPSANRSIISFMSSKNQSDDV